MAEQEQLEPVICHDCGKSISRKAVRCRACHCRLQNLKPVSVARRYRMSLAAIGNLNARANRGKPKTKLHRERIGRANKGQHAGANAFGYQQTKSHRENIRLSQVRRYQDPEQVAFQVKNLEQARRARDFSPEARQRMAERAVAQLQRWPKPTTKLELSLYWLLREAGFCFETQKRFGRYLVDAFVASHNLVFEADGFPWHKDREREARRDAYLMERDVVAVIHLVDEDLEACVG